jgi:hypothetical protein
MTMNRLRSFGSRGLVALSVAAPMPHGCEGVIEPPPDTESVGGESDELKSGGILEWDHFHTGPGAVKQGADVRFRDYGQHNVQGMKLWISQHGEQKGRFALDQGNKEAGFNLVVTNRRAKPGQYYKGWLLGTVEDSNNKGAAFCGQGDVTHGLKAAFRAQLQMRFFGPNGKKLAGCYCNLCPLHDGDEVVCSTDQWHIDTAVSDHGACRAPAGTDHLEVYIEGVAKPANDKHGIPAGKGTAVIKRFRFARCDDDGRCAKQTPDWYTQ